eukprot:scaffold32638_cov112-Isochrysis_galbana.AAC.1
MVLDISDAETRCSEFRSSTAASESSPACMSGTSGSTLVPPIVCRTISRTSCSPMALRGDLAEIVCAATAEPAGLRNFQANRSPGMSFFPDK